MSTPEDPSNERESLVCLLLCRHKFRRRRRGSTEMRGKSVLEESRPGIKVTRKFVWCWRCRGWRPGSVAVRRIDYFP